MVPGVGIVNSGMIGVMSLILLSWTGRLGVLLNSFKPIATIFLILYGIMLFAAFVNQEFGPYGHHYYFFVVPVYLITGMSIGLFWLPMLSFTSFCEKFLRIVLVVASLNSIIIIASFLVPDFRLFLESLLYQDPGSNINYLSRDYRLRGLAAGGAANQSLFLGSMVLLSIGLFLYNRISLLYASLNSFLLLSAVSLVGRTGYVAAFSGVAVLLLVYAFRETARLRVRKAFLLAITAVLFIIFLLPNIVNYFFPVEVFRYSLKFFYGGVDSISDEGTVGALFRFYHLPESFVDLLIGVGNGSGSFVAGEYTDPGYMKMFTAVGLFGALIFYASVIGILTRLAPGSGMSSVILGFACVWFLAEFKEPFMLKGYLARTMWFLIGAMIVFDRLDRIKRRKSLGCHCNGGKKEGYLK